MQLAKPKKGFWIVLSNVGFLFLWIAQLCSQLADRIFVYILMILAYSLTNSSLGVSIPMLAFGIPSVLFGVIAGVYVDRWNRKKVLGFTSLIRGALLLLLIPLITKSMLLIFLLSLLLYTAAQFFAPAETSVIPDLVEKDNLIIANSLFMLTWMAASVIGFGMGAPLVNFLGEPGTIIAAAVLYFVATLVILFIKVKPHEREMTSSWSEVYQDLLTGFEFIRRNAVVRYSLFKLFMATCAIAGVSLLAIAYAKDVLQIGAKNFGYLIILTGVGMFAGMYTLHYLVDFFKKGTIVVFSFFFSGVMLACLGVISNVHLALLVTFFLGVGNIYLTSTIQTILQQHIPKQMRGRVFGVQNMLINSAFTFPVVLVGLFADAYGVRAALIALGAVIFATGVAGVFLPHFKEV
ncbi:MAG: MFS transporter [Candidatus Saganbacteria bacterium]|nr:MFS transporter [Candidatus Saganbacteria bacterium]